MALTFDDPQPADPVLEFPQPLVDVVGADHIDHVSTRTDGQGRSVTSYVDHISGVATRRPELDRLLDNARPGDTIVIWRLDRLGRSMKHLLDLIEDLELRNIARLDWQPW